MKVSVEILAYNKEKYICQALDSVLMQQVNFDYEIVIGEDCSTDNTRDIVKKYRNKHPDKIRLLLHEKNLGTINNEIQIFSACQGEYIAKLDGDDYWTSPHKLQKQVDYLDNHQECPACFHPVKMFWENGIYEPNISPHPYHQRKLFIEALLECTIISTCSFMFRKSILNDTFLNWYSTSVIGDWEFYIYTAQQGGIGYLNEVMADYRKHSAGIYTGASSFKKLKDRIEMFKNLNAYLEFKYNKTYKKLISQCYHALAIEYIYRNKLSDARTYFIKSVLECSFNPRISQKDLFKIFVRLYVPQLYKLMGFNLVQNSGLLA